MQYYKFAKHSTAKEFSDAEINNAVLVTDFRKAREIYAKNGVMTPIFEENDANSNKGLDASTRENIVSAEIVERFTKTGESYYRLSVTYNDGSNDFRLFGSKNNDYLPHILTKEEIAKGRFIYAKQDGKIVKEDPKVIDGKLVCCYRTYFVPSEYLPAK